MPSILVLCALAFARPSAAQDGANARALDRCTRWVRIEATRALSERIRIALIARGLDARTEKHEQPADEEQACPPALEVRAHAAGAAIWVHVCDRQGRPEARTAAGLETASAWIASLLMSDAERSLLRITPSARPESAANTSGGDRPNDEKAELKVAENSTPVRRVIVPMARSDRSDSTIDGDFSVRSAALELRSAAQDVAIGAAAETSFGNDGGPLFGGAATLSIPIGAWRAGLLARGARGQAAGVSHTSAELLGRASIPIRFGAIAFLPSAGVGLGWQDTQRVGPEPCGLWTRVGRACPTGPSDDAAFSTFGLRTELGLGASIALAAGVRIAVDCSLSVSPLASRGRFTPRYAIGRSAMSITRCPASL